MTDKIQLVNTTKLEQDLTSLASKIRESKQINQPLNFPNDMIAILQNDSYVAPGHYYLRCPVNGANIPSLINIDIDINGYFTDCT